MPVLVILLLAIVGGGWPENSNTDIKTEIMGYVQLLIILFALHEVFPILYTLATHFSRFHSARPWNGIHHDIQFPFYRILLGALSSVARHSLSLSYFLARWLVEFQLHSLI